MFKMRLITLGTAAMLALGMMWAHADSDEAEHDDHAKKSSQQTSNSAKNNTVNAKFLQECSSCHIAYPARMLPAASWQKLMSGLNQHFGTDASLEPADQQEISQYLQQHASSRRLANTDNIPLRISEMAWFKREHNHEISAATWKSPKVKSPANCGACHQQAAQGNFDEDQVKIPR